MLSLTGRAAADEPAPEPAQAEPESVQVEPESDQGANETSAPRSLLGRDTADEQRPSEDLQELPALPGATGDAQGVITRTDLDEVGAGATGLLAPSEGGLDPDMWAGTKARLAARGLRSLPVATHSRARQELVRLLLLSTAHEPAGSVQTPSILTLRAGRLYEAGLIKEAATLLNERQLGFLDASGDPGADGKAAELEILKLETRIHLMSGEARSACSNAALTRQEVKDRFWLRLRTFCYVLAGDRPAAELSADLLRETGLEDDLFYALFANLIYEASLDGISLDVVDEIHIALVELAGEAVPVANLLKARAPLYHHALKAAGTEFEARRIAIASRAVERGIVAPPSLAALYDAVDFAEGERDALLAAGVAGDPRRAAALHQAAALAVMPVERAKLLKLAYDDADRLGRRNLFVALYGDEINTIPVEPALDIYALDFAWIALAAGSWEKAAGWLQLAERVEQFSSEENWRLEGLQIALTLVARDAVGAQADWSATGLPLWNARARLARTKGTPWARQAILEISLHEALGGSLEDDTRRTALRFAVQGAGAMPRPGVLSGLDAAARAGRTAEVVLYTLHALGDSKSAQIPLSVLTKTVSGLLRAGFSNNAKTLAIESLLAGL